MSVHDEQARDTARALPYDQEAARPTRVRNPRTASTKASPAKLVRQTAHRNANTRVTTAGGSTLHMLVLSSTLEDTISVDLATGTVLRVRIPWPEGHELDINRFDIVEVTLAEDPERDDLAHPEAATVADLPRHVATLRGRSLSKMLSRLVAEPHGPLLGFTGTSAPYWEFRGLRPSVALVEPYRRPQVIRRPADRSSWIRFGWEREDVWLPIEDEQTLRALDAARPRHTRLTGRHLAKVLGYEPQYLLVTVSAPRDGRCYKVCSAVLPGN